MRGQELLMKMELIDPRLIMAAEERTAPKRSGTAIKISALAASFALVCAAGFAALPYLRGDRHSSFWADTANNTDIDTVYPDRAAESTAYPGNSGDTVGYDSGSATVVTTPSWVSMDALLDSILELGMGGGSFLFDREYQDFTYDISYISAYSHKEAPLVSREEVDRWTNEVFLAQTPEEQNALPTLYQAIKGLGIKKEDFAALNDVRRERGDDSALSQKQIDALYLDENEMKRALVNDRAMYYEGEIYTLSRLTELIGSDGEKNMPLEFYGAVDEFIRRVIRLSVEDGLITKTEAYRRFGYKEFNEYE